MDNSQILSLLPLLGDTSRDRTVNLPLEDDNIFSRIIRDPNYRMANERRCSEMLCSVLRNTEILRNSLLIRLSEKAGKPIPDIKNMSWVFDTEQPTELKRIDLTITGSDAESGRVLVYWIVEIKVQSPFNMSSRIVDDTTEEDEGEIFDRDDVNQLENYDDILGRPEMDEISNKCGFVLTIRNAESKLPKGLKCKWTCLTWTELGMETEKTLKNTNTLSHVERFLGRHMLGFINKYLWRDEEMGNNARLSFEDVALIKATFRKTADLEKKVCEMVFSLGKVIEVSGLGTGEISKPTKSLFTGFCYVTIGRKLLPKSNIILHVGFDFMSLSVALQSLNKGERVALEAAAKSTIGNLKKLDGRWNYEYWNNKGEDIFDYIGIYVPIEEFLSAPDQLKAMQDFVRKALSDMKTVKIIDSVKCELGKKKS